MAVGDINIFKASVSPKARKSAVRTEMDQNRFWMYFTRRAVDWLKKEKGYKNVAEMTEKAPILNNMVRGYRAPAPNFFLKVMRNEVDALVSECTILFFFDILGVDMELVMSEASKDYMEECLMKYKLVPENYVPVRPLQIEEDRIHWMIQSGSNPYSKKGKKTYGYYTSPYRPPLRDI